MATWKDIKLSTLQKMFAAEGTTIPQDESTVDYLAAMPYTANEALQLLSTAGKFIIKKISLFHNPIRNLVSDGMETCYVTDEFDKEYSAYGARSYAFQAIGYGKVFIYVDKELKETIEIDTREFQPFSGMIDNTDKEVKLVVTSDYTLAVKQVALYRDKFRDVADIPQYEEHVNYDLKSYAEDYFQLNKNEIFYRDNGYYNRCTDFHIEGNHTLVLPRDKSGNYDIYYRAYPDEITAATEDNYELPLAPEVVPLLPLYMASQLYKDDDNGIATSYRNEFEVAFERLSNGSNVPVKEQFVSESGWI